MSPKLHVADREFGSDFTGNRNRRRISMLL